MSSPFKFYWSESVILIFFTAIANGQFTTDTSSSNEFLVGFPVHIHGATSLQLYIHAQKSLATFNITTIDGNFEYTGTCSPLNPAVVDIPLSYEVRGCEFTYRQKSLKVFSNQKLSVLAWSYSYTRTYSVALFHPSDYNNERSITPLYIYYAMSTRPRINVHSQILIIGCQNNSNVIIIPSQTINIPLDAQNSNNFVKTLAAGENHSIVLHSMQTLLITSLFDLTSSKIISDKQLSVISGAECADFPSDVRGCDFLMTQVPPTVQWGMRFLLSPHKGRHSQAYKILANANNTSIVTTCSESTITEYTLNTGQSVVFFTNGDTYCSVVSSQPIYMAQFGVSIEYDNGNIGDPTLSTVPPVEQYVNFVQFTAIPAGGESYYSIVIQSDCFFNQSIVLDGTLQPISSWKTIYNYNGAIVGYGHTSEVFTGTHTISHPNSNGVLSVMVYGWQYYGGYSYAAGSSIKKLITDDGMVSPSCTTDHECNPHYSKLLYEVCCDPDNIGNFVTVFKSDIHLAFIACPAATLDWCLPSNIT